MIKIMNLTSVQRCYVKEIGVDLVCEQKNLKKRVRGRNKVGGTYGKEIYSKPRKQDKKEVASETQIRS